jgi:glycolate oxidase iron-sulfur subunit
MAAATDRTSLPVLAPTAPLGRNIDYELFMDCVHCGLCLGSCPTYVETGNENDSPRGRIYLWRAIADGRAPLSPEAQQHLDLCLECRACESACPSGVQYGQIIGSYKKDMARLRPSPTPTLGRLQRWLLFHVTPYARRMRWALAPVRFLQRLGLGGVVNALAKLLPRSLRQLNEMVPPYQRHPGRLPEVLPPQGRLRAKVALLTGCAADAFYPETTWATAHVLAANGCEVWVPPGQVCCGALHYHTGLVAPAQDFAWHNIAAVQGQLDKLDAIISNAGGCGPVLKEYGHLLHGTPAEEAGAAFAKKVKDVHEFLVELGPVPPTHALPITATYHDACGLSHAQKIRSQPRTLLQMIPGLKLVPLAESEHCCGAAGSYNLTQPEMAEQLGARKAGNVLATGAQAVFAANVGCLIQIGRHVRRRRPDVWVAHPMDALWAAYSGQRPAALASVAPETALAGASS